MNYPRRTALRIVGAGVATALAGCAGGDGGDSDGGATEEPTDAPTDDPTEEPTDAPTEEPTDAPTGEPTDAPTEEPTDAPTEEPTDAPTEEPTDAPTEQATVTVAPDDRLRFDPETLEISPGTEVTFVWEDGGHNVAVRDQPDGADWQGVPEIQDEGYTHTHTFEVEGRYDYVCEPHESFGMVGSVVVGDA